MVRRNGQAGVYYVSSDTGNGRYLAATPQAVCGARCTCPDYERRGSECKHIRAAMAYAEGQRVAQDLA